MLSDIRIKEKDCLFKTHIVQQTAFWSIAKSKFREGNLIVNFKSRTDCLILLNLIPNKLFQIS